MTKKIAYIYFKCLELIDNLLKLITGGRSLIVYFNEFLFDRVFEIDKIKFVVPNALTLYRAKTLYSKEVETIEWINNFQKDDTFWDIGANVGIYSIYAAHKTKCNVVSFEPSTLNLKCLTRNISLNNLQNLIKVFPIALTKHPKSFLELTESSNSDGGSHNTFGENYDSSGDKIIDAKCSYFTYGDSIDSIIESGTLSVPDYIKIDVDGIEHFIIEGGLNTLKNKNVKEILIEISENFEMHKTTIINILKELGFEIKWKKSSFDVDNKSKYYTLNYLFQKK